MNIVVVVVIAVVVVIILTITTNIVVVAVVTVINHRHHHPHHDQHHRHHPSSASSTSSSIIIINIIVHCHFGSGTIRRAAAFFWGLPGGLRLSQNRPRAPPVAQAGWEGRRLRRTLSPGIAFTLCACRHGFSGTTFSLASSSASCA